MKNSRRLVSVLLCIAMVLGTLVSLSSCTSCMNSNTTTKPDALVLMTDELDGLFNPFFSTTAADGTIVGMTQIGMLTTGYENGEVTVAFGDNEAVVVKDYISTYDEQSDLTTYTFVLKNGITFSDGKPLTMNDVLFNLYVYLDPVYTGSSTMYSTDIVGLTAYRTQKNVADDDKTGDNITSNANTMASDRIKELINIYNAYKTTNNTSEVTEEQMKSAIAAHKLTDGYKAAISNNKDSVTNQQLLDDYNLTLQIGRAHV